MVYLSKVSEFVEVICGDKVYPPGERPLQGELKGYLRALGFAPEQVFKF